ncbi:hypothetical protein [Thermomicrobium sp.]
MTRTSRLLRLLLTLLLALAFAGAGSMTSHAERPNGAGLVIRFGDGRVITAYVQFEEPTITGIELLQRAGVPITVAPFGGLGLAVCAISGEGCPAEDCFCRAKSQPAWFWHYYGLTPDGSWVLHPVGASNRIVRDGDVDGWSWTATESGLPSLTIEEIARAHGIERSSSPPAATQPTAPPVPSVVIDPTEPAVSPPVPPVPSPGQPVVGPPTAQPDSRETGPASSSTVAPTLPTPTLGILSPTPPTGAEVQPTVSPTAAALAASSSTPSLEVTPSTAVADSNATGPPWGALIFTSLAAIVLLTYSFARWRRR